jgi:hypothetical protein
MKATGYADFATDDSSGGGVVTTLNADEVRRFCEWLHSYARWATSHLDDPGQLQLTSVDPTIPRPRQVRFERFEIGDHRRMTERAIERVTQGRLVWVEARTIRRGSLGRGESAWVLAIVIDYDGYGTVPFLPSFSVQTSPGHAHLWYLTSLSPEQGQQIGQRMRNIASADADTGVTSQPYILAGVPNFPTFEKVRDQRRTTIAQTFVWTSGGPVYSFLELNARLPAPATQPLVFDIPHLDRSSEQISELMWAKAKMAYRLFTLPTADRSRAFSKACWIAFSSGLTPYEVERFVLNEAKSGCASKWLERGGQPKLREELTNQWCDWSAKQSAAEKTTGGVGNAQRTERPDQ